MPADIKALEAGARVEAQWDGREFDTLGRADKARYVERFAAAIASYEAARETGWRPIETAPRDGTEFQAWFDKYGWEPKCRINPETEALEIWGRVDYDQEGWDVYSHLTPTHWQPLPTAPLPEQEPRP